MGYVPDSGLVVSLPDEVRLDGFNLAAARPLPLENKISAELRAETEAFIVEFHADIDATDARMLLHENRLEEHYHPDLLPQHALVYGNLREARRIAASDEVAYVYPASAALTSATRVNACPGALTAYGLVAQYVSGIGDGWDGTGLGTATLGYYFGALTARIPRVQVQTEILRAFAEWSKYVRVDFGPAASPSSPRTIAILFGSGSHGDSYPFDGPGKVLAHTFYPAPANPESIAGDMHFDNSESWRVGQDMDVFSVALHEAGHALGLAHSDRPDAVMYPYYAKVAALTADDVAAVRQLYAGRAGAPNPDDPSTPTTPTNPTTPTPPTKPQKPAGGADTVPPTLKILVPGSAMVLTSASTLTLSGTATDKVGVVSVIWTDSLGNSGTATGTTWWKATGVPLRVGTNVIVVKAYDAAGNSAWRSITVTRKGKGK